MSCTHGYTLHSYSALWMPELLPGLPKPPLKLPTPEFALAPSLCTSSGITTSFSSSSSSASGLMLSAQKPHPRQQSKLSYSVVSIAYYKSAKIFYLRQQWWGMTTWRCRWCGCRPWFLTSAFRRSGTASYSTACRTAPAKSRHRRRQASSRSIRNTNRGFVLAYIPFLVY